MSDDTSKNLEVAAATPEDVSHDDNVKDGGDCVTTPPIRKTPHDQNENEVIEIVDHDASDVSVEDSVLDGSTKVVDLTEEETCRTSESESSKDRRQTAQSDEASTQKQIEVSSRYKSTSKKERVGTIDSEADQQNQIPQEGQKELKSLAVVLIDNDNGADDVDVYSLLEDEEPKVDEIIISDSENIEEEDESKSEILDLSLESNEVIILEETDHTDSIADPLQDPLAIDDCNTDVSSSLLIPCGSAGHSDISAECEIIFSVDIERGVLCEPASKSKSRQIYRNKRASFVAATVSEETRNEEQEVRSDGSDSGLGLESSTLQSNNSSVAAESPVCKPPPVRSNLKRRSEDSHDGALTKRPKNAINFNGVKVYYFPRIQGFGCVPSQGGCTLGMAAHHIQIRSFSLAEHITEQRRAHKQQMQEINPRNSSSDETESEEELSEASGSDMEADANGFLQPVPPRQRRAILKAAGIRKIDPSEKDDCRAIRSSREFCGCNCRGYCDPDTCSCSQSGIKCQVDRPSFPCGCTRDGCANVIGRVEFNPSRVRTHYIHTIMRLDLENKQKRAIQVDNTPSSSSILSYGSNVTTSSLCNYSNLVNTSNMRQFDATGSDCDISTRQQNANYNLNGNSILYSNRVLHSPSNVLNVDGSSLLRQVFTEHGASGAASGESNIVGSLSIGLQSHTGHNHDMDLHYAFRDDSNTTVDLTTPTGTNSMAGLGDYSINDQGYHEMYSGHSFLSQNYSNAPFCQSQPVNYQQSFIDYIPPGSSSVELLNFAGESSIHLTEAGPHAPNPNYPSLNSPAANQSCGNSINDLLTGSRNVTATSSAIASSQTDPLTSVSFNMPPSAQTSTSITEGTQTTVTSPQMTKPTNISHATDTKHGPVVDLTDRVTPPQDESGDYKKNDSGEGIVKILDVSEEVKLEPANDVTLKGADLIATTVTKLVEKAEPIGSDLDCSKSDVSQTSSTNAIPVTLSVPNGAEESTIVEQVKA